MPDLSLKSCDQEPVQFIGAIQAFGALLIADPGTGQITYASENSGALFGRATDSLAKLPVSALFAGAQPSEQPTIFSSAYGEVLSYTGPAGWYLELEPTPTTHAGAAALALQAVMDAVGAEGGWKAFLGRAAQQFRQFTGYDRVMIYRFHADDHGEVVAESCADGIDSFLGLHYPASDIPAPARKVFYDNWVRIIPDAQTAPLKLLNLTGAPGTPDLGRTLLRSVSPVHLEYLANMGVRATLTVSIKSEGRLWGLIACHHLEPKLLDRQQRQACEQLGRLISASLGEASSVEEFHQRSRLRAVYRLIRPRLRSAEDIGKEILQNSPSLLDLIHAEGASAALYNNGRWESVGQVPADHELDALADWLQERHADQDIFKTDTLPAQYEPAAQRAGFPAGLLALRIPKTRRSYVLLFRPERTLTVRWAGRPDEKHADAEGRLHPRRSFAEWSESVRGRSEPWMPWEVEAAMELRTGLLAADLHRQFEREQAARLEAERAMQSREELMAVLSHDLKNPIGSILLQSHMMERGFAKANDTRNLELIKRIQRASENMNSLINDILHVTKLEAGHLAMERKTESVGQICREVIDMLGALASHNDLSLRLSGASVECEVSLDRERIIQVLSNLIGNAIKFTPRGGVIEINVDQCGPEEVRCSVSDTGPGIPAEHRLFIFDRFWQANQAKRLGTGLGLAISKGIVEAHGGRIWVDAREGGGSVFHFTLPLHVEA